MTEARLALVVIVALSELSPATDVLREQSGSTRQGRLRLHDPDRDHVRRRDPRPTLFSEAHRSLDARWCRFSHKGRAFIPSWHSSIQRASEILRFLAIFMSLVALVVFWRHL